MIDPGLALAGTLYSPTGGHATFVSFPPFNLRSAAHNVMLDHGTDLLSLHLRITPTLDQRYGQERRRKTISGKNDEVEEEMCKAKCGIMNLDMDMDVINLMTCCTIYFS